MGRWLIILTLSIVQIPDLAAAATRSSDVPLWRRLLSLLTPSAAPVSRPQYQYHRERPVKATAAPSPPVHVSTSPAPEPRARTEPRPRAVPPPLPDPTALPLIGPLLEAPLLPLLGALPEPQANPEPQMKSKSASGCNGGRRIISAYYWEGRHTASGQPFNPHGMTAAHRTLPFGTHLTVTNPRTGQSVVVVINDRGPFVSGVTLDLSLGAAQAIGMHGTGSVCIS
jgi:rare lipoprotein A